MSDLKIKLIAEIDESSIGNMTKQLKGIQEGVGKIKIDIDTNEVMSRLIQLESKMKPMDLKIDTAKASAAASGLVLSYDKVGDNINKVSVATTSLSGETQNMVRKITDSTNASGQLLKSTQDISMATGEVSKEVNRVTSNYKKQRSEVEKLNKIQSKSLWGQSKDILDDRVKIPDGLKEMNKYYKDLEKASMQSANTVEKSNQQISKSLWGQSKDILDSRTKQSDEIKKMGTYYKDLERSTGQATTATKSFGETMGDTLKRAVGWVSLTVVIRTFAREIKKGVEMVKEIDSAMVELKKVTSATDEEYFKFMSTAFQTGKGLARTGTEVINATADFARMGFELKAASGLAKEALLMLNVGDGIESLDDATSSLISTLRGFKVASEDSVGMARTINDAFNEVANNFAIDTGSIASSTKRVSSVMHEAGNDIYETTGLITGAYEVMQNPEKVSSGLNIITQRLQAVKQVGGELTPTIQKAFDEIGLSVLDSNNEMKSTYQILGEVASIYPTLTDLQQKYVAEAMSGKRQSTVLKAIVGNWEQVEAATEAAKNSLGSAQVENMVYLDSIEGKMQGFTSSMQEFWSTAIDSDAIKSFVDMGTSLVGTATSVVDSLSGMQMALLPLIPILGVKFVNSAVGATKSMEGFEDLSFGKTFQTLIPGLRGTMVGADGARLSFNKLTIASIGLKAALFLVPVAIAAIVSAEKRRKQAMLDTVEAFKEQKEMSNTVSGLVDRYRELSSSTEEVTKNSGALATIKERLKKLMPESAAALDDETLSYKEQADVLNEINALNEQQSMDMALDTISKYGNDIDKLTEKLEYYKDSLKASEKGVEMYHEKIKNGEELTSGQLVALQRYREGQDSAKEGIENTTAAIDVWHDSMDTVNGKTGEITTQTELFAAVLELKLAKSANKSADEIERLEDKISRGKENIGKYGDDADDTARKISDFGSAVEDADGAVQNLERTMSPEETHLSSYAKQALDAEKNVRLLTDTINDLNEGKETSIQKEVDLIQISDEFIGFTTMSKEKQIELLRKYIGVSNEAVAEYKEEAQAVSEGTALMQVSFDEATQSADASKTFWNGLDLDTKQLIIETSGLDEASEDFHQLLSDWLVNNPEKKELVISMMGEKYVSDNIDALGDKWKNLSDDEKEFLVNVIGKGLDEFEDFEQYWAMLNPEVKKFLAEQAGLEDIQDADYETMQSWAKEPLMKLFLAQQDGLENVRIERNLTDGVWEVTIDDVTYRTNEEGGSTTRTSIQKTLDLWNPIPRVDTKKTIFESIFKTIGSPPKTAPNSVVRLENNWTGDDNFKGGLSFVGEKGRELLMFPDGSHDMTGDKAELRNLPRGTKIYNNQDTEDILAGKKNPEFSRSDKRLKGGSNTPGFAGGNTKAGNPMPPNSTSAQAKASAKAKAKAATSKTQKEHRAEYEIYTKINIEIDKQNNLIKRNAVLQEKAKGHSFEKIRLLQEEIRLEKQHQKLLNDKINVAIRERNQQEALLKKSGFKFKGSGHNKEITNLENIKGKNEQVEAAFNKFNELQFKTIPGLQVEIMEMANAIQSAVSEGFVQHTRNVNHLAENSHYLEMNAINQERATNDTAKRIELMKEEISLHKRTAYLTRGQAKLLRDERDALARNLKGAGAIFEGTGDGRRVKDGTQNKLIQGKSKEIEEQLRRFDELQFELIPSITIDEMKIEDAIKQVVEEIHHVKMEQLQVELSVQVKAQDELQYQKDLLSDDDLDGRLSLTQKIAEKELEKSGFLKSNIKDLEKQLKTTKENSDEWHMLSDSLEEYQSKLKDSTLELKRMREELVQISQEQAKIRFDESLKSAETNIFGGQTEEEAKEELDAKIKAHEDYIDGEEKALEIAQIRKMVEDESLSLTKEQQAILNEGGEVERAKLDRLNKQLEIQKLQSKLENQKNQKTIKQLVKKDDGTFDFEYVADSKAIKETENAILESKKDLANWESSYRIDQEKRIFEEKQKLLAKEEKRLQEQLDAEMKAIEEHYKAIMERQIAMMEMNMLLMEQLNSEKSIGGWTETLENIIPLMDELGVNFADLMEELGIDLKDNFDVIFPLLYDMGLLNKEMVDGMGVDFEKYIDKVIPVLDEIGIDHKEFLAFMGVDLETFLQDAGMSFTEYSEAVREKNAQTKEDVKATKDELRTPTESTHTVHLDAPPPFSMPDSSSTHTIYTETVGRKSSVPPVPPVGMATGGYTGSFSGGKVAVLHEKERVLSKQQTVSFEKLVNMMPNILKQLETMPKMSIPKVKAPTLSMPKTLPNSVKNEQVFNIDKLEFPNVKDAKEIEKAIADLPTFATQWAKK